MSKSFAYLISAVLVLGLVLPRTADAQGPGLAGWWRLDGDATDSSANGNNGTVVGNPQWVVGKIGDALDFDGADDYVDCGNGPSLNVTGPITISAWVYPTGGGGGGFGRILDKSSGSGGTDPGYKFYPRLANNYVVTLSVGGGSRNTRDSLVLNSWNYFAFVATGTQWRVLINGTWQQWNDTHRPTSVNNPLFIGNGSAAARHFDGMLDDVRVYSRALTDEEIQKAMKGSPPRGLPSEPIPDHEATDVPRDVTLSWTPGEFAQAVNGHTVYFSANFNDVNDGIGGVRQSAGSYTPPQRLNFETTYYWRVDEASAPPGSKVYKGSVWSFTTEPFAYPIENVTATALSSDPGKGPENTVNGSGLDASSLHSTDEAHMWLSQVEPSGAWIQYEFDKVYALHQMLVWNHNSRFEYPIGFGVKEATIEYSLNGTDWITLGATREFARATGLDGYAHNTTVEFGGIAAKYVKLTASSNWGGLLKQYGLSEVRFLHKPLRARGPNPASGASGVGPDAVLTWRTGREATRHDVYFGTDQQAVVDGTVPVTSVTAASYDPLALDLGTTYYWKVNEVNVAEPSRMLDADVWSFATSEYVPADDFESYNDIDPPDPESHRIFEAWIDGYATPTTNGALVGNEFPPYMEQTIVHDGVKSMPFRYNNAGTVAYSQAERTFAPAQDWTKYGLKTLSLWFRGEPNNTGGQFYVKVNGAKQTYGGDASSLTRAGWQWWNIDLASFGVSLQSVTKLAVGIDGAGASGKLYLDDIRLYAYERRFVTPTEPTAAGLAAHYKLDQNATDNSGNNNHGTLAGGPQWVAGKLGGALQFDGVDDYVDCGAGPSLDITSPITISAWVYPTGGGGGGYGRIVDKSSSTDATGPGYKIYPRAGENYIVTLSVGGGDHRSSASVVLNTWNYMALIIDGTQWKFFLNGTWQQWNEDRLPSSVSNPLFIGNSSIAARHFQGMMDDVRIYNRALSQGEIAWLGGVTAPFEEPF